MSKVSTFTAATWRLVLHVTKFTTLTQTEYDEAFDTLVHLLELANDERYRVIQDQKERN